FFFQAEDGIRDRTVTGVQTCALPISSASLVLVGTFRLAQRSRLLSPLFCFQNSGLGNLEQCYHTALKVLGRLRPLGVFRFFHARSEERRVGKECRFRGATAHYKKYEM